MKKKIIALILAGLMLINSGCSYTVPVSVKDTPVQNNNIGTPWINSNIQANITDERELSPRDDFYLYANYDWLKSAHLNNGQSSETSFSEASAATDNKCLDVLLDDSLKGHDALIVQSFYKAWLDWDARNAAGLDPIKGTIEDIESIGSIDELSDFICDPDRSWRVPTFLGVANSVSFDDSSSYITFIFNDNFTLGDAAEYSQRTEKGDRYYEASLLVAGTDLTRLGYSDKEVNDMFSKRIALEEKLAGASLTNADKLRSDYYAKINNVCTPSQVDELGKNFPIKRFIKSLQYDNAKEFLVMQPDLIKKVDEIYTDDNLDSIKAYMIVGFVIGRSGTLDRIDQDAHLKYRNIISGASGSKPDEIEAYSTVRSLLPTAMDKAYLSKYDASGMKERIKVLCGQVIDSYRDILAGEEWLSADAKKAALEKLDNIKINAVYPDKWKDTSSLDLEGLSIYDCYKAIDEYENALDRMNTGGRVDNEIWEFDILDSNAYYNLQDNSINIILGLLEEPFYYDGIPDEDLLGGLGTMIGHEISHAFDSKGAMFDKDGNYRSWWTDEDSTAFSERAEGLKEYYNTIIVMDGQHVNGEKIEGEAIADMAGLKSMLIASEKYDDFDYDRFFRSYAYIWRGIFTREAALKRITQDSHPMPYLRANVTLAQFDKFCSTYDIKEGDNMYIKPEDRIAVW